MFITLEPHDIFYTYACQQCLTTDTHKSIFDGRELAEHQFGRSWSVSENMRIPLESHGIFGYNFAYLFILILSNHWYTKHDDALLSIILAGQGL